jgi:serine/threonine protein kinase
VFLAHQCDLADRLVVLKVSAHTALESLLLAQLQHANIVPIHSAHRAGRLQALCMPYLGSDTLADVYRYLTSLTHWPCSGRGLANTLTALKASTVPRPPAQPAAHPEPPPAAERRPDALLERMGRFGYVKTVLWLGEQLADGLAHAHERGVVHRDVKPANVLLTDGGWPMLLDFNMATDTRPHAAPAGKSIGGTLPYMSPEQLEVLAGHARPVDLRSDVYSLGVILFELLTLSRPYPAAQQLTGPAITQMCAERAGPPPRLHSCLVSYGVESIVRRCLEPDPDRRYQSARELKEDLGRQQADLPLRYASDPSLCERFGKWARRHADPTYAAGLAAVAAILLAVLSLTGK